MYCNVDYMFGASIPGLSKVFILLCLSLSNILLLETLVDIMPVNQKFRYSTKWKTVKLQHNGLRKLGSPLYLFVPLFLSLPNLSLSIEILLVFNTHRIISFCFTVISKKFKYEFTYTNDADKGSLRFWKVFFENNHVTPNV